MNTESLIHESLNYLASGEASKSIDANPYWPKWNSPWWHMSVLFEMGMAECIPKAIAKKMLAEVKRTHLPYFFREEAPADKGPDQDAPCPCAFGNIYQILSATGLDVDAELPWARGWFLKYQMPDGGLNCDRRRLQGQPSCQFDGWDDSSARGDTFSCGEPFAYIGRREIPRSWCSDG
jgi:hypothetical protein